MKFGATCSGPDFLELITDQIISGNLIKPLERPFEEDGSWRTEFTENGVRLVRKLFSLPCVKKITFQDKSQIKVEIYDLYRMVDVLPEIKRAFAES